MPLLNHLPRSRLTGVKGSVEIYSDSSVKKVMIEPARYINSIAVILGYGAPKCTYVKKSAG